MKNTVLAFFILCLFTASCNYNSCPYKPGQPTQSCSELREKVTYDESVDIFFIDPERDTLPTGSSRKPVGLSYLEWIMTWDDTLTDGSIKKLYIDTVATCPCDAEIFMLKGNPEIDPQDRRTAARDKDPGATQFLESDFFFPIPDPPVVLDEVRKDTATGKRGERADNNPVEIAIIDTGVDDDNNYLQPVLSSNIPQQTQCPVFNSSGFDFANISYPPQDDSGHGTHVTGIAAERGGRVKVSNYKFTKRENNEDKGRFFDAICALKFAIQNRVDIINCSWGYYAEEANPLLKEMINQAQDEGIMIVAAAGNHTQDLDECPFWPASFGGTQPNVITVGSVDAILGAPSTFTNYGSAVHLFAHGENIYSPVPGQICGGRSGTSMAAPVITGLLAKYIQGGTSFAGLKDQLLLDPSLLDFRCENSFTSSWNKYLNYIPEPCP